MFYVYETSDPRCKKDRVGAMTHYVQRPGVTLTACGMSRQLAVEIGDIETSEIEHVECSNCLMVLVSIVERLPEAKRRH